MNKLKSLESTLKPSPKMPVLFVGHGNPMNAILDNDITHQWSRVGKNLPEAQAFVVISAHWYTKGTHITDAPKQPIIYDFYGFPDELYKVQYDANGDPDIANQLRNAFLHYEAQLDSSWGLDHGTWSVMKHLAPKPTVPILQISLDINQTREQVVESFEDLRHLRERGVIFIGSGNIIHNLRLLNWGGEAFDWAEEFDQKITNRISGHDLKGLINPYKITPTANQAVESDDHYRPMLAVMSLLDQHEELSYFNQVIDMGSVGMRSFITI
ncbi:dioxygenase [Candidatus Saccharibacteria bacterium]|nr:dioxygenase [Candidatus Saccharibacteria bacterium]